MTILLLANALCHSYNIIRWQISGTMSITKDANMCGDCIVYSIIYIHSKN